MRRECRSTRRPKDGRRAASGATPPSTRTTRPACTARSARPRTGPRRTPGTATGPTAKAGRTRPARARPPGAPSGRAHSPFDAGATFDAPRVPVRAWRGRAARPGAEDPPVLGPGGGPAAVYGAGPGWPWRPRRSRWPRWSRRPGWRGPAVRGGREGQAQGRLVAALDLEEGARRHRRRVRGVHPRPGRRLLVPVAQRGHSRPRSPPTYQNHDRLLQRRQDGHGHDRHVDRQDLTYQPDPEEPAERGDLRRGPNFCTEGGISPTGILRAAYDDLTAAAAPRGGSTITQEFVRNYYSEACRHPADGEQEDQGDLHRAEAGRRRSPSTWILRTT